MTQESRHVSVHIGRPAREIYDFCANPANLPQWAAGLSGSIEQQDGEWVAESPMGRVVVRFVPANDLGVLDHRVTLEDGQVFENPMRVIPDGSASADVVFTVRRADSVEAEAFEADVAAVTADLERLKGLLESPEPVVHGRHRLPRVRRVRGRRGGG